MFPLGQRFPQTSWTGTSLWIIQTWGFPFISVFFFFFLHNDASLRKAGTLNIPFSLRPDEGGAWQEKPLKSRNLALEHGLDYWIPYLGSKEVSPSNTCPRYKKSQKLLMWGLNKVSKF